MTRNISAIQLTSFLLLILVAETRTFAQTVFTHRVPEAYASNTPNYEVSVLKLALDKTRAEYGNYELKPAPQINVTRSIQALEPTPSLIT